jgi:hypothetical protein
VTDTASRCLRGNDRENAGDSVLVMTTDNGSALSGIDVRPRHGVRCRINVDYSDTREPNFGINP